MEREDWLALELTQKLIKHINLELTQTAVNASKGNYANSQNADATQFFSGVAAGNVGAYQRVKEMITGAIPMDGEADKEVVKEYEA